MSCVLTCRQCQTTGCGQQKLSSVGSSGHTTGPAHNTELPKAFDEGQACVTQLVVRHAARCMAAMGSS